MPPDYIYDATVCDVENHYAFGSFCSAHLDSDHTDADWICRFLTGSRPVCHRRQMSGGASKKRPELVEVIPELEEVRRGTEAKMMLVYYC
jgi:hypothetical protein